MSKKWRECFKDLVNLWDVGVKGKCMEVKIGDIEQVLEDHRREIWKAVEEVKYGKTSGVDKIFGECWRIGIKRHTNTTM